MFPCPSGSRPNRPALGRGRRQGRGRGEEESGKKWWRAIGQQDRVMKRVFLWISWNRLTKSTLQGHPGLWKAGESTSPALRRDQGDNSDLGPRQHNVKKMGSRGTATRAVIPKLQRRKHIQITMRQKCAHRVRQRTETWKTWQGILQ